LYVVLQHQHVKSFNAKFEFLFFGDAISSQLAVTDASQNRNNFQNIYQSAWHNIPKEKFSVFEVKAGGAYCNH